MTDFAIRLVIALLLGTFIGVERQWHRRLADLKVTALVCVGSALFTTSFSYFGRMGEDPTRIAAQIVVGVGFLGAGLLWRDGGQIRGITTAATLWCAAAVGVYVGVGAHVEATVATVLIVAANALLRPIGRFLSDETTAEGTGRLTLHVEVDGAPGEAALHALRHELQAMQLPSIEYGRG